MEFKLFKLRRSVLLVLGVSSIMSSLFLWQRMGFVKSQIEQFILSEPPENETLNLACIYPDTDPFNPEIRNLYKTEKTLKCTGKPYLTYVEDGVIHVNSTKVAALYKGEFETCAYREIVRTGSDDGIDYKDWSKKFNVSIKVGEKVRFVQVFCTNKSGDDISHDYHVIFSKKDELHLDLKLKKHNATYAPDEMLNVMMIGVDGTSRNQIIRDMPKTYSFLTEDLQGFDMEMYSQVGINTFPNLIALLGGHRENDLRRWWKNSDPADDIGLSWDKFKNAGYRTLFVEDYPGIGGFNYLKTGFHYKPLQYYIRTLSIAVEKDSFVMNEGDLCIGDMPVMTVHMNHIRDFASTFREKPYFAFLFNTRMTHGDVERAGQLDDHIHASLKRYSEENLLNNTLVFFFTDHGPRWGRIRKTFQGSIEGRSPIGLFAFPQWFVKKYPDLFNNFRINTKRLTTHFDTHTTLLDIVNFKSKGPRVSTPHGVSLFQEISPLRTCETASIPDEFCLCGENNDTIVAANSSFASKLAVAVLKTINEKRNKEKCAELLVDKILNVYQMSLKLEKFDGKQKSVQFKVTLQTKPGGAQYTSTVSKSKQNSELSVGTNIIRLNKYRGTAECVDDALIRPFCYCLNLQVKSEEKKKGK